MQGKVDLYDGHYGRIDTDPQVAVRRQTYDEDVGQASWIMLAEARELFRALDLSPAKAALEVACGSGGITCSLALTTGARCVGVDINATHHRSATSGTVTGVATAVHLGRTMATYEVVITDERGKRVCTSRITCALIPRDRFDS